MSLTRKRIDAIITKGVGRGEEPGLKIVLTGHKISAQMVDNGCEHMGVASVRIYGVSLSHMNELLRIGPIFKTMAQVNQLQLAAGDDGNMLETVFVGDIWSMQGNLQRAPDTYLDIHAQGGGLALKKPVAPNSWQGKVPAIVAMKQFADEAGFTLEYKGVPTILNNPYFYGTAMDKIRSCARSTGARINVNCNILTVSESDHIPQEQDVIPISPANGLVGYPIFSDSNVMFKSVFNPRLTISRAVYLTDSEIDQANGRWQIETVSHSIESETPGGEWFSDVTGILHG